MKAKELQSCEVNASTEMSPLPFGLVGKKGCRKEASTRPQPLKGSLLTWL